MQYDTKWAKVTTGHVNGTSLSLLVGNGDGEVSVVVE
jgi:hypothetical protein